MIRKRNSLTADMEKVSMLWVEDQTSHNMLLSQSLIQSKAVTLLFCEVLRELKDAAKEKSESSRSWIMRVNESCLQTIKVQAEVASANVEAAATYPDLVKITNKRGYIKQQISTVDATALYQKKMPPSTFIVKENSLTDLKVSKDKLALF